jgi:hypothetical protein
MAWTPPVLPSTETGKVQWGPTRRCGGAGGVHFIVQAGAVPRPGSTQAFRHTTGSSRRERE